MRQWDVSGAKPASEMPARQGRLIEARLGFARGGGRTFLQCQNVPYPFHITRPHALDATRPELVTLILQSASGGLYHDDRLMLDITAGPGALAQVSSQAATVVHAAAGEGIAIGSRIVAAADAFLAVNTDPCILFPDTALSTRTDVRLDPIATVVVSEGFATHDPGGGARPFRRLATRCRIALLDGTVLVDEGGAIDGGSFLGSRSPLGTWGAMGAVMILGAAAARLEIVKLERELDRLDVLGGGTMLPNGAGVCVRLLAPEGGRLARGLDAVVGAAFEATFGRRQPIRRR